MSPAGALAAPRLATVTTDPPVRGAALTVEVMEDAAIAWDDAGAITYVGPRAGLPADGRAPEPEVAPAGTWLAPGFVDPHTHLPFIGWRADEYAARLAGATYAGVQGEGGGIPRSARMLAAASDEEVLGFSTGSRPRCSRTGPRRSSARPATEARSRPSSGRRGSRGHSPNGCRRPHGHAAAVPRGARRVDARGLGRRGRRRAHPRRGGQRARRRRRHLRRAVDRVHDPGPRAGRGRRGREHGLALRVHADQLEDGGGAAAAVAAGARAADHLNHAAAGGVAAIAGSDTAAVLLPASTFCLGAEPAPARALIDAGATVALGTDANPGTSPVVSMPETIAIGCRLYGLSPAEALAAATANAAHVLGLGASHGRLAPGHRADVLRARGRRSRPPGVPAWSRPGPGGPDRRRAAAGGQPG